MRIETIPRRASIRKFLCAVGALVLIAGCGGGGGGGGGTAVTPGVPAPGVTLVSIAVTPSSPPSVPKGLTQQFKAVGYYSNGTSADITTGVTWNSSTSTAATIDATGLAKAVDVGATSITASVGTVNSNYAILPVGPAVLQSFVVTPANPVVVAGLSKQLTATGSYSDGTSKNLTSASGWSSSDVNVAQVYYGQVDALTNGTVTVTASYNYTTTANVTLTVKDYIVSGKLSDLPTGASIVLQNGGKDDITLSANGNFTFATPLAPGASYDISVLTQPPAPAHSCYVINGKGTIATKHITDILIVCGPAVSTFAGSGNAALVDGTGKSASFYWAEGVAVDGSGNVYVADYYNNAIRKITPAGVVTTLAGSKTAGSADGTGAAASFNMPEGIAVDTAGNVYVADTGNNTIRKITAAGVVTTFAGKAGMWPFANGTGANATFRTPTSVAVDASGNLYVADSSNQVIRKITPAGSVTTLAGVVSVHGAINGPGATATFSNPVGVAVDASGNVYVADAFNNLIRKITPTGVVSTLAGSVGVTGSTDANGTAATFSRPNAVAVDNAGNVYVQENYKVRKINSLGDVTTMVGAASNPSAGEAVDGSAATATFWGAKGIAFDATTGNWYVGDSGNNRIRKIMP